MQSKHIGEFAVFLLSRPSFLSPPLCFLPGGFRFVVLFTDILLVCHRNSQRLCYYVCQQSPPAPHPKIMIISAVLEEADCHWKSTSNTSLSASQCKHSRSCDKNGLKPDPEVYCSTVRSQGVSSANMTREAVKYSYNRRILCCCGVCRWHYFLCLCSYSVSPWAASVFPG